MTRKYRQTTSGLVALLFVFAIPLSCLVTSHFVRISLDRKWIVSIAASVQQQNPAAQLAEKELDNLTPTALCDHRNGISVTDAPVDEFCARRRNFLLIDSVALGSAGFGLFVLLLVAFAGRAARLSKIALRFGFLLSLGLTRFMMATLFLVDSALVLATFYYSEAVLTKEANLFSATAIAFLLGIVAMRSVACVLFDFRFRPFKVPGQAIKLTDHRKLQEFVGDVFHRCLSPMPDNILVGTDFILFAADVKIKCGKDLLSGSSLFFSLPLCRLLSKGELSALLAHELAHHQPGEQKATRQFYPAFEAVLHDLDEISLSSLRWLVFPITAAMKFLVSSFLQAESTHTRARELAADLFAAEKFGRDNLARALVKLYAFTSTWDYIEQEMRGVLAEGKQIINSSEFFATLASVTGTPIFLKYIALSTISHPIDRHPLLGERLGALEYTVQDLSETTLGPKAQRELPEMAIDLFQDYKKLEEALTDVEHLRHPQSSPTIPEEISKMFEPPLHSNPEDHEREIA